MALDPKQDTERRIRQMVAFIKQEAAEKAEEIQARAAEECNVEVMKMVDKDKAKIRDEYKIKAKQVEIENKIEKKKALDMKRMDLLNHQDQVVQQISQAAKDRFAGVVADRTAYSAFLKDSMKQAMFKIWNEKTVEVQCRKEDEKLVKQLMTTALAEVKSEAQEIAGETLNMEVKLNKRNIECTGGVVVSARRGRIVVNNTLDARLKLAIKASLPYVKERIFCQEDLSGM